MYQFVKLDLSESGIQKCSEFLYPILRKTPKTFDYLNWEYNKNPLGKALGFNALYKDQIVAHYVTQPIKAVLEGKVTKGLLALHVATHPDYRGKKIFTEINNLTHEYASFKGYKFVVGVANSQSTYGYVKTLGFQSVCPLDVKIGFSTIKFKSEKTKEYQFKRIWNDELLSWRLCNPMVEYKIEEKENHIYLLSPSRKFGIHVLIGLFNKSISINQNRGKRRVLNPLRVWIGKDSEINWKSSFYFNLPTAVKPSPLNLIFKDLTASGIKLVPDNIKFQIIDFDIF